MSKGRIYFKRSTKLLLTPGSKLSDEDKAAVNVMLSLSSKLSRTYALKEEFYKVFRSKTRLEAKRALGRWLWLVDKAGLEEFKNYRLTFRRWFEAITNIIKYQVTNGFTEGINNDIKVLKRVSYGIKTFKILRNRVLFYMA
jgi:transposase